MSLTNALDAIAIVGAIILVGEGKSTLATVFGTIAIVAAMSNVVRRVRDHGSDAQNVQGERARRNETAMIHSEYIIELWLTSSPRPCSSLALKWLSSPSTARRGVPRKLGMLLAITGTLFHHGIVDYKLIAIALVFGTIIGVPLRHGADDGRAPANRAEPRVVAPLRDARRHGGYYLPAPEVRPFS